MKTELQIIRPKELCSILNISIATLYNWEKNGTIPIEKRKFGPNCVGYLHADVKAWLNGDLESEAV